MSEQMTVTDAYLADVIRRAADIAYDTARRGGLDHISYAEYNDLYWLALGIEMGRVTSEMIERTDRGLERAAEAIWLEAEG